MVSSDATDELERERARSARLCEELDELGDELRGLAEAARGLLVLIPSESCPDDTCGPILSRLKEELGRPRPRVAVIREEIEHLRESIYRQEIQRSNTEAREREGPCAELLADVLTQVCRQFAAFWPDLMKNRVDQCLRGFRDRFSMDRYFAYLDEMLSLFGALRREMDQQNLVRSDLVKTVVQQLLSLEQEFLANLGGEEALRREQWEEEFRGRVENDVEEIETALRQEEDLNRVRRVVMERVQRIRRAFAEKRKRDRLRAQEMARRIEKLKEQLKATREEFERVRAQSEQAREEAKRFRLRAMLDPLTGIYNRSGVDAYLASLVKERAEDTALILFDIDRFKQINDAYGHPTGDRVLKKVVDLVRSEIRKDDFLGRLGGDEFVVVFRGIPRDRAVEIATKIRERIGAKPYRLRPDTTDYVSVTLSLGMAWLRPDDTVESWLARADQAMYRAKEGGRNALVSEAG